MIKVTRRRFLEFFGVGVASVALPSIPIAKEVVSKPELLLTTSGHLIKMREVAHFYCPYIPLKIVGKYSDSEEFVSKVNFKTRYARPILSE